MTLAEITADIALYQTARDAILVRGVKSYEIGGSGASRSLTALDLPYIEDKLTQLRYARDRASTGMFLAAQNRRPE